MSSSYFVKSGNKFKVCAKESLNLCERLPTATYSIGVDPCDGQFVLQPIDAFAVQGKLYGDTVKQSSRILQTFHDRTASTGVLLVGEKGSGKTLLAKYTSIQAAKQGIPTIVINSPYCGENFNMFLQSIAQPVVILFDEYEKVYAKDQEQEQMLTLLDGVYPSKKLFLLTCNNKWRINTNMRNRPGRIFYLINFSGLSNAFITEYCQDNLEQKQHIVKICAIARLFSAFNFDMLKALVEEMNRFKEPPSEAMKYLNTRPEFSDNKTYSLKLFVDGKLVPKSVLSDQWSGNPLTEQVPLRYTKDSTDGNKRVTEVFDPSHLRKVDGDSGQLIYVNQSGAELMLKEKKTGFRVNFDKLTSNSTDETGAVSSADDEIEDANDFSMVMEPEPGDY